MPNHEENAIPYERDTSAILKNRSNPGGSLTIATNKAGKLYLYSIDGRELNRYEINNGKSDLSLPAGLTPGVYIGRFMTEDNKTYNIRLTYQP